MRCYGFSLLLLVVILFSPWHALSQEGGLAVTEMAITTRIVHGNPVDSVRRISSSAVRELYCFTKFAAPDDTERQVVHLWYKDDQIIARCVLPVKGTSWRTYSKKTIADGMAGDWRVDVLDSAGAVLKSKSFRLN